MNIKYFLSVDRRAGIAVALLVGLGCGTYDLDPDADVDGDGHPASLDCQDGLTGVHPGAEEVCDGLDNDCDGRIDSAQPGLFCPRDDDDDGVPDFDAAGVVVDCDDSDAAVFPDAEEVCDGLDNDCDGLIDPGFDEDGDGHLEMVACAPLGGTDCDDGDALVNPCMLELCDGRDNDCDGTLDEPEDHDGDGFRACLPEGADCDDLDATVHPGVLEVCDGTDNDCDGQIDEPGDGIKTCDTPLEACDGIDNDGDGLVDEGFDQDGDGVTACGDPVTGGPDCDDTTAAVRPGLEERCDGQDNDCDGEIDEGAIDASTWYRDLDSDGWGDPGATLEACAAPNGYVARSSDCDDANPKRNPATREACNGLDDDCDGVADDGLRYLFVYPDSDGDGYGDATQATLSCGTAGYTTLSGDCDEKDPTTNPGVPEVCGDKRDNNCNGEIDEGC